MQNIIICPHCKKEIELTQALTHEISQQEIEKEKKKLEEQLKAKFELSIKDKENETREAREQNKRLMTQILELNTTMRGLRTKDEQRELELQKQVAQAKELAKLEALKLSAEDHRLKDLEKEKTINDLKKMLAEAQQKAQQGSMQTQGEVLELDWEKELRTQFPNDEIKEVGKGVRGADVEHIVKTPMGKVAGTILWENKRTKHWEDKWLEKLKADQRASKAELAAIITNTLPLSSQKDIQNINKIWVTTYAHAIPLAHLLREQLLAVAKQKAVSQSSASDAQMLYDYMTGHEFSQHIEAIIEVYLGLQEQIAKERAALEKQWSQRDMQIKKLYTSLFGMYGNLAGIVGQGMPQIKGLEIAELEDGETDSLAKIPTLL